MTDYIPPFVSSDADRYYSRIIDDYQKLITELSNGIAELEKENKRLKEQLTNTGWQLDYERYK